MKNLLLWSILCWVTDNAHSGFFTFVYPRIKLDGSSDAGSPLMLTPYIERGAVAIARKLSRVEFTQKLGIRSHAGFLTVNKQYDSNHYIWYFPAVSKAAHAPLLLWLQGGPGGSSLFGLFTEIGPIVATEKGFKVRDLHWAQNYHLLFVDNPVGTGFSYTSRDDGYCEDELCVARDLYSGLLQFYRLFPNLVHSNFFITGESYAGKYIPALAMKIHEENEAQGFKINLKGMAMGNAYCDPINQMDYGSYLYQLGLLDQPQKEIFLNLQNQVKEQIRLEHWIEANLLLDKLMYGDTSNSSYFKMFTGYQTFYDYRQTHSNETDSVIFANLLKRNDIRKQVHVGSLPFHSGEEVMLRLINDLLKSVASQVAKLLSYYKIMLYNGQLDIVVAYPLTEEFVKNLNFSSSQDYKKSSRHVWYVDEEVAGYVKVAGNLTEVLVRNAGHMVPHDQPKVALDMISRFVEGKPFWN